jgi:CBS domain-containing protein
MKTQTVKMWMTSKPITIHPQNTLPQARKVMEEKRIRRLPVIEDGELVGIITLGDIREAQPSDANTLRPFEMEQLIGLITVDTVMTANPVTVTPDTHIMEAAQLMLENKIGGLPVLSNGELVGIITETDFCRLLTQI